MHRFFIEQKAISGNQIVVVNKDTIHHIRNVLHLKKSQQVSAADEKEDVYLCRILEISNVEMILKIVERQPSNPLAQRSRITLACALPKDSRMGEIVDKATQLGVDRIIPLWTTRVVVRLDQEKSQERHQRWEKIALSASQQSHRCNIPKVEPISQFKDVLANCGGYDLKIIFALSLTTISFTQALNGKSFKNIIFFIGPEGDFTPEEIELAKNSGLLAATLGQSVLRVETAALYVLGILHYLYK